MHGFLSFYVSFILFFISFIFNMFENVSALICAAAQQSYFHGTGVYCPSVLPFIELS